MEQVTASLLTREVDHMGDESFLSS